MGFTRLFAPAVVAVSLAAATGCSSTSSESDTTVDPALAAQSAVVADYVTAFNDEDVVGVMATMSPAMDRLPAPIVECEHQAVFEQTDATLSIDSEADPSTGARAYEVTDAAGEVRDSGAVTFVFVDDGLLNGTTLPLEVGADFGVDFSACA
jgi:hypothetical protein